MSRSIQDYYCQQSSHHQRHPGSTDLPDKNTTDYWRHERMYETLLPLLRNKRRSWLTIGDGKYGKDAEFISHYCHQVMATDLNVSQLKIAKKLRFIKQYRQENAEKLRSKDNAFDYVFCKESYHHFPRPTIALYEMLRVCRQAVVLIEPHDVELTKSPMALLRSISALFSSRRVYFDRFEQSGNYVYTISVRELEKVALGLGLSAIAFRGIDDHYLPGVEQEINAEDAPLKNEIKRRLFWAKIFNLLHLRQPSLLAFIIFKTLPSTAMIKRLELKGYTFKRLPINPFLNRK